MFSVWISYTLHLFDYYNRMFHYTLHIRYAQETLANGKMINDVHSMRLLHNGQVNINPLIVNQSRSFSCEPLQFVAKKLKQIIFWWQYDSFIRFTGVYYWYWCSYQVHLVTLHLVLHQLGTTCALTFGHMFCFHHTFLQTNEFILNIIQSSLFMIRSIITRHFISISHFYGRKYLSLQKNLYCLVLVGVVYCNFFKIDNVTTDSPVQRLSRPIVWI